jgi:glutaredoxin
MLQQAAIPFELVVLSMRGGSERRRFRDLRETTGHTTLPQIFVDDEFIGGEPELRRYLEAQGLPPAPAPAFAPGAHLAPPDAAADGAEDAATGDGAPRTAAEAALPATDGAPTAQTAADVPPADGAPQPGPWADALGYGGLVPFAATAAMIAGTWQTALALDALLAYGAVILSFVGAVHWGFALRDGRRQARALVTSVIPSLAAWASLLLPTALAGLAAQMTAFALWHGWERLAGFLPPRYLALRLRLTIIVVLIEAGALTAIVLR